MKDKVKVGIIGCGNISGAYLEAAKTFEILEIKSCADLDMERAKARAEEYGIKACGVKEMLSDSEIQVVVNLTTPLSHTEVNLAAIEAGKHIYCEKPLAVNREDGLKTLEKAKEKEVLVGCAPDTFLGGGLQTCRKLIDDGWIGKPVAATGFAMFHGHESWHPEPEFYYEPGGGPMLDMGPYYITALVTLLGSVKRVTGSTQMTFTERVITSKERFGETIPVHIPTHYAGVMDFENNVVANIIMSFDVWNHQLPCIEIYGTEGTLSVPDPNAFGGPVKVRRPGATEWAEVPLCYGYNEQSRSIGVADMAYALLSGRGHRANGQLAYHALDIMLSFEDASQSGQHVMVKSKCVRPDPLPLGLPKGRLDP